jgi:hypothetical protein
MKKTSTTNKKALVLDFDGTLYFNVYEDFSMNIHIGNIFEAEWFFYDMVKQTDNKDLKNTDIILVTGRPAHQQELVLNLLKQKGYNISHSYFLPEVSPLHMFHNSESIYYTYYWFWKVRVIEEIRLSDRYSSITVIDDDQVICSILNKLSFPTFQAEIELCSCFPRVILTQLQSKAIEELPAIELY